jgi:tryptophan 7-halogenase
VPCPSAAPLTPYTRSAAKGAGWIWRIPLQHRVGNGHVYCSSFIDDDSAERELIEQLEAAPMATPNRLRFLAGKRRQQWVGNCVAIGLSAGFLEPLESTSIHLIQLAIGKLIELFPGHGWDPLDAEEFNRSMAIEYERVRDFLILHYCCTQRDDSPFWDYCRTMALPDSLVEKLELFRERGVVAHYREGMFLEPSWIAVYVGQNIIPSRYNPLARRLDADRLAQQFEAIATACASTAMKMPSHDQFLRQIGAAQ